MRRGATSLGAASAIVVALSARPALAGNDDQLSVGAEASLAGNAVIATVSDGAAGYHNPAGLAQGQRQQIDASVTALGARVYAVPALIQSPTGESAGDTRMEFVLVPTATTYTRRLSPRLVASVGIFSPRSQFLVLQQHLHLAEPAPTGTNWSVAVSSVAYTYLIGPSLAWQVSRRFSVGASLHVLYDYEDTSVTGAGGDVGSGELPAQAFVSSSTLLVRTTLGLQAGLGFQWQLGDAYRLGFAVQSPGMQLVSSIESTDTTVLALPSLPASLYDVKTERGFHGRVRAVLPLRAGIGLARFWGSGHVEADLALQSALPSNDLFEAREAVLNARLGARWKVSESLDLGVGLFSDRAGGEASSALAAVDSYGGTLGFASGSEHRLAPGESTGSLVFGSSVALRYAYGRGHLNSLSVGPVDPSLALLETRSTPISIHELMLNLGTTLNF